ncbi:hypothetical protein FB45DRAFT_186291 [Roridomyces roridus]|uniref:Uncharacterized protein n=1 Tax=Roridomyces roridus TaxID=1738132 RepID=A0AAD7CEQ8_9AGAR|nr:hypothetical protein FB45DRAFT_186291 [Roridomyces roridus]
MASVPSPERSLRTQRLFWNDQEAESTTAAVQFTVDDTSPAIFYAPFGDSFSTPALSAGWNPYWSQPGFSSANLGATGIGQSLHITSRDGASLQIIWKGTGITLYGNVTDASYNITIDGEAMDLVSADLLNNTLAAFANLTDTNHTLSLTARTSSPESLLEFDRALLVAPPPAGSGSALDFTQQVVNDTAFAFRGQWNFLNDSDLSHESTNVGDSATLQFRGTSFLLLGLTSPTTGSYSVTLDNVTTVFSGKSSFSNDHSLLFFASGLDAETVHDFEIVNTDGGTLKIPVANATVFAASTSSSPSGTPTSSSSTSPISAAAAARSGLSSGTIAALVLGAVMIILVVVGLLAYVLLYRPHKRRQRTHRESPPKETHDEDIISVLEVAPEFKKTVYDDLPPIAGPSRDRTSRRSGFTKWKEEVEGGLGSWGRSALGIAFRHSGSTRMTNSDSSNEYDMEVRSDSYKTSSASGSSNGYGSTQGAGKGKGKSPESRVSRWTRRSEQREASLSPRYKLDLPIEPTPRSASHSAAASTGRPDPSVISSLSYMSSPSIPSSHTPSVPPARPSPYPNTHTRAGSAGALLVHDTTQPTEPDDGYIPTPIHAAGPSAPLPPIPVPLPPLPEPTRNDDSGSVREYDVDDGKSVLGDGSARIALRSLSPRTVQSDQRNPRSKRRDKEKRNEKVTNAPATAADISPAPDSDTSLVLRNTSPFRVDFDQPERRAARLSGQSRVRFENAESVEEGSEQDPTPAVANRQAFRLTPPAMQHPQDTSFLDFTSSSDVSLRTRSNAYSYSTSSRSIVSRAPDHSRWSTEGSSSNIASIVPPPQPTSRWSATTAPSSDLHRDPSDGSSASFPFPVSLPASPHHPEGTFADAPSSFGTRLQLPGQADENGTGTLNSLNAHPADLVSVNITSPTDSVPMSVSDIHFQSSEAEDGEGSHHSSNLPTHPPLPPADEVPYIVQRVLGLQTPSTAGFPTPTPTAGSTRFTRGSPGS